MSANIAERTVELGTLRAAGLSSGIPARLVAAERLPLTRVGVPLGPAAGIGAHRTRDARASHAHREDVLVDR